MFPVSWFLNEVTSKPSSSRLGLEVTFPRRFHGYGGKVWDVHGSMDPKDLLLSDACHRVNLVLHQTSWTVPSSGKLKRKPHWLGSSRE